MSVKTIIDRCKPYCAGFERSTGKRNVLDLIQEAVDELWEYDSPYMLYIESEDNQGWPPYLQTTAGIYTYKLIAANLDLAGADLVKSVNSTDYTVRAYRPIAVFTDATSVDYSQRFVGQIYQYSSFNPYSTATSRTHVSKCMVDSGPAIENEPAWIRFKEDPGTSTAKYFCLFSYEHPRLSAETIPLLVPRYFYRGIEDYVIGRANQLSHGREDERLVRWEKKWLVQWRQKSAMGAQSRQADTRPRLFG